MCFYIRFISPIYPSPVLDICLYIYQSINEKKLERHILTSSFFLLIDTACQKCPLLSLGEAVRICRSGNELTCEVCTLIFQGLDDALLNNEEEVELRRQHAENLKDIVSVGNMYGICGQHGANMYRQDV
jgi:hypothetical protein